MSNNDSASYVTRFNEVTQTLEYAVNGNWVTIPTAAVTPAGVDRSVQYNSGGILGGDTNLTWDSINHTFVVNSGGGGSAVIGIASDNLAQLHFETAATNDYAYFLAGPIVNNDLFLEFAGCLGTTFRVDDTGVIGSGEPSALLNVTTTTKGFLPPRLTTVQKNAIAAPATGLMLYDTTLNKLCVFTGAVWETVTSV